MSSKKKYYLHFKAIETIDETEVIAFQNRVLADGGTFENYDGIVSQLPKIADASFVFVPSGFKTGKVYNFRPTVATDFSYSSNAASTRVNSLGNTVSVAQNVPRIDYTNGFAELLLEPTTDEKCINATNTSMINSTEGTFYIEVIRQSYMDWGRISITDGGNGYVNSIYIEALDDDSYSVSVRINSTLVFTKVFESQYNYTRNKIAVRWKAGDYAVYINGVKKHSSTYASTFTAGLLKDVDFSWGTWGGTNFYGRTKSIYVYNTAKNDDFLANLTSL